MNLSKIFESTDTFQPADLVQRKEQPETVWQSIVQPLPRSAKPKTAEGKITSAQQEEQSPPPLAQEAAGNGAPPPESDTLGDAITQTATDTTGTPAEPQGQTEEMVGLAPEVVDQMVADAFENGVQQGIEQGLQRAEEDFGSAAASLMQICQQLDHLRETILQNSVGEMQDLVLVIAEKIIRHSLRDQHETILNTVDEAIHKAVKSDEFYVFVNPEDYDIVNKKAPDLVAGLSGLSNLVVKKDNAIEPGGCKIESDNCTVDATIASQLKIIQHQIKSQR